MRFNAHRLYAAALTLIERQLDDLDQKWMLAVECENLDAQDSLYTEIKALTVERQHCLRAQATVAMTLKVG